MPELLEVPHGSIRFKPGVNHREVDKKSGDYKDLAASVLAHGVFKPVLVTRDEDGADAAPFVMVDGAHRWHAAQDAKLPTVPAIVREFASDADKDPSKLDAAGASLAANLHSKVPSPLEVAMGFQHQVNRGNTPEQVAALLDKPPALVVARLQILTLSKGMQAAIHTGQAPLAVVRPLARVVECAPRVAAAIQSAIVKKYAANGTHDVDTIHRAAAEFVQRPSEYVTGAAVRADKKLLVVRGRGYGAGLQLSGKESWLTATARRQIDEMNVAVPANQPYFLYHFTIPVDVLRGLDQGGPGVVVLSNAARQPVAVAFNDAKWLSANSAAIIQADFERWTAARAKSTSTKKLAKGDESAAEAAERRQARANELEEARAHVRACGAANVDLGVRLFHGLASTDVSRDVAMVFAYTVLHSPGDGRGGSVGAMAARGLGYVLPDWHKTVTMKNGKDKTEYPSPAVAEELFWKWFRAAKTPEEIFGRALVAMIAARYAQSDAIPKGQQTHYVAGDFRPERDAALDRIAKKHIPTSIRILEQKKAA